MTVKEGPRMAQIKFRDFKGRNKKNGLTTAMTYDEWYEWWMANGVDKQLRQPRVNKETLIMLIKDPTKPFTIANAQLGTYGENDLGLPSSHHGVERPQVWTYSDRFDHERHEPYLRARAQWNFRGEENDLTFEQWCELWTPELWPQRGRKTMRSHGVENYALTRIDPEKPWTMTNVEVVTRTEQIARSRAMAKLRRQ